MLNENLAKIRKERGLTQEALAVKLNVVRQTISKWEKGTAVPDADTLCKIADALDVPVSELLGSPEHEINTDTALIAKALSQINEQLAIRTRHTANVWKAACIVLLVLVGALIGKTMWNGTNVNNTQVTSQVQLPEKIEISGLHFYGSGELMSCSFVPGYANDDMTFRVSLHNLESGNVDSAKKANYKNGVCTVSFNKRELYDYEQYNVILNIECGDSVYNITLAENLSIDTDGYTWSSDWS